MPTLTHSLQGRDLGHLRIIAERWGIDLKAPDTHVALQRLAPALLDRELLEEIVAALPEDARDALADLLRSAGRLPWPLFTKRYGEIRKMGPAKRDRERPDRHPASPAETLWYHALVARNFLDTAGGPQEFAYIPEDLIPLLPAHADQHHAPLGRPASPAERARLIPVTDHILDHATTLLAALRMGTSSAPHTITIDIPTLQALLTAAGLLNAAGKPLPEPTRAFLRLPRSEALAHLTRAWLRSADFDELRLHPKLQAEGEWPNDPHRTRHTLLDFIATVPPDAWWSLPAFVAAIRNRYPDYQRPAGDYDSWYLKDTETGAYLRGFAHWDKVDGRLVRWLITGPLHWLGALDLAAPQAENTPPAAFRLSGWAASLLQGAPPEGLPAEDARLHIRSDGQINVPRLASRAARYQVARFTRWDSKKADEYRYRLTPTALTRATDQGLRISHLIAILSRHSDGIPPNITQALRRWETHGAEANVQPLTVLRLGTPDILAALRKSRAARFLADPLGPATIAIKPGAEEKVLAVLAELGWLGEIIG